MQTKEREREGGERKEKKERTIPFQYLITDISYSLGLLLPWSPSGQIANRYQLTPYRLVEGCHIEVGVVSANVTDHGPLRLFLVEI
jgi:hypothetical protein